MANESTRSLHPMAAGSLPLAEEILRLTVDRIVVSGLELAPQEAQRFEALLITELKRLLAEQAAVFDAGLQNETLRSDWSDLLVEVNHPADLAEAVHEVARRLALSLQNAAQRGAA